MYVGICIHMYVDEYNNIKNAVILTSVIGSHILQYKIVHFHMHINEKYLYIYIIVTYVTNVS